MQQAKVTSSEADLYRLMGPPPMANDNHADSHPSPRDVTARGTSSMPEMTSFENQWQQPDISPASEYPFNPPIQQQPQWNANYIPPPTSSSSKSPRPSSPNEVAAGARSPEELLRRLSLAVQSTTDEQIVTFEPRTAFAELQLTGNVISATFCVPHRISYRSDGHWVGVSKHQTVAAVN
jgi:trehalose 6-phosphate synthase/phosphatase